MKGIKIQEKKQSKGCMSENGKMSVGESLHEGECTMYVNLCNAHLRVTNLYTDLFYMNMKFKKEHPLRKN